MMNKSSKKMIMRFEKNGILLKKLEHNQERLNMDKLSIGKFNFGVIKQLSGTKKTEAQNTTSAQSNPFGINFKGNVYAADVFESSKPKNAAGASNGLIGKAAEKAKMFTSTIVGGINSFNNSLKSRFNTIISFGKQVKDNIAQSWENAKNTNIEFDFNGLKNYISSKFDYSYSVSNLQKKPVVQLEEMLLNELSA